MKAVLTVVGKDTVGILAAVSGECAKYRVNINEVSQSVLEDVFCMMMLCDISDPSVEFGEFSDKMDELGKAKGLAIQVMHSDLFDSMHRI